jgi:glutathione S-transferase
MTPAIFLHHYPGSPFAEKARLMLGYKGLIWQSVFIPMVMPKPDVVALTGGYRKTPILQIGADIYCDTALIAEKLEELQPAPALFPAGGQGLARTVAQWADSSLFWAAVAYSTQPAGMAQMFEKAPAEALQSFAADRKAMSAGAPSLRPADATSAYRTYLDRLDDMLSSAGPYLLGDRPCIADFSAYHPLWFTRKQTPALAGVIEERSLLTAWMDRMAAIGHGQVQRSSSQAAIEQAGAQPPAAVDAGSFQNDHGLALGSRVTVAAESFGTEATEGVLVAAAPGRYTLAREDERAGRVHVHFPRIGYVLRAVRS